MSQQHMPGSHLHGLEADPHRAEAVDHQSEGARAPEKSARTVFQRRLGLVIGLAVALLVYALLPDDLAHILELAGQADVRILILDADAPALDGLPLFEYE